MLLIVLVTLINLYYKPYLIDRNQPLNWLLTHPISKTACALQGFQCPSDEMCDCEKFCSNGKDFVPFRILSEDERIYVLNQKLSPGAYCLPKGVGKCNLKTSYHVFTLAGWSCIGINDDIFKKDKKKACQNEEAQDNNLNMLYDYKEGKDAGDNIENYYELYQNKLRYNCQCNSRSLDNTPMISIFPFVCSVDYCLRDLINPAPSLGWNGNECKCGPYPHLDSNDRTSPCRSHISKIETKNKLIGRVECMTKDSFVKQSLICPTSDGLVVFNTHIMDGNTPENFIKNLIQ